MLKFLKRLSGDERGNVIAIVCACMPLVVGAAGLATDTIQWTLWKRQLQRAADSAAMSGVYTSVTKDTDSDVSAAVTHDLTLNLHTWMALKATPTVTRLGTSSDGVMKYRVYVKLQIQQSLPFSSIFMSSAPTIIAESTAASVPSGAEYCVVGLDKSAAVTGVTISGSTYLDLGTCSLIANSTNPTKAASNGTSSGSGGQGSFLKAASLDAAGGVNYSSSWNVTSYNPYSTPVTDPFYNYKDNIPSDSSKCTKTASIGKSGSNGNYDRSTTDIATDTVCLNGNQTIDGIVKLGSATYVINGGDLTMNSSTSSLSCNGCTIVLTNFSNPANTGSIKLTGGTLSLTPPHIGTDASNYSGNAKQIGNAAWNGVVLYQDPRAADDGKNSPENSIRGNSSTSIQGVVYTGNQSLEFNGGGKDVAACLQVTAKRITFSGNSYIKAASLCGDYGLSPIAGGRRVRLVA